MFGLHVFGYKTDLWVMDLELEGIYHLYHVGEACLPRYQKDTSGVRYVTQLFFMIKSFVESNIIGPILPRGLRTPPTKASYKRPTLFTPSKREKEKEAGQEMTDTKVHQRAPQPLRYTRITRKTQSIRQIPQHKQTSFVQDFRCNLYLKFIGPIAFSPAAPSAPTSGSHHPSSTPSPSSSSTPSFSSLPTPSASSSGSPPPSTTALVTPQRCVSPRTSRIPS
ncbi:MAG: hypothetical protein BYD32DRAFT_440449 [Podila humilis]|nr:MAG: hypothetical protein BYD32DRAFT_440449 [Podila humilis]